MQRADFSRAHKKMTHVIQPAANSTNQNANATLHLAGFSHARIKACRQTERRIQNLQDTISNEKVECIAGYTNHH